MSTLSPLEQVVRQNSEGNRYKLLGINNDMGEDTPVHSVTDNKEAEQVDPNPIDQRASTG